MTLDAETTAIPGNPSDQAEILATQSCIVHILGRIWQIWHHQISLIHDEHANLEDHVYEAPADSSCAANIWAMSQHLHDMLKLMNRHAKVIEAIQEDFQLFAEIADEQRWLDQTIDDFAQLSNDLSTDYLEPLEHMMDLVRQHIT
jgi:Mg2+ and Co2+ transporter CorA